MIPDLLPSVGTQVTRKGLNITERRERNTFYGFALAIEMWNLMNRSVLAVGILVNDPFTSIGRGSDLQRGNLWCQINSVLHGFNGCRLTTNRLQQAGHKRANCNFIQSAAQSSNYIGRK